MALIDDRQNEPAAQRIDCDIHPSVPNCAALFPHLDDHWREMSIVRGIDDLHSANYPDNTPLTVRPDWKPAHGRAATSAEAIAGQCLDPSGSTLAICNCLFGIQTLYSEDLAGAYAKALNDWVRTEFLDKDARLRASIIVSLDSVEMAVEEIHRCAADHRFVQVLLLVATAQPLGKRHFWPIYEAAVRYDLPIGIHAGSEFRNPPTPMGWPSYYLEDYVVNAQSFQSQLTSLFCEGVFNKFPTLMVVMLESGWTWLPAHLWRMTKYWHGLRMEIPWADRSPAEVVKDQIRFSLQPIDGPGDVDQMRRLMDHIGTDDLLVYSSDYPHNQFAGADVFHETFTRDEIRKITRDTPLATYPRLRSASS